MGHQAMAPPAQAAESLTKSNGLPRGWRRSRDGDNVHHKLNGWLSVVRVAWPGEKGPFVIAMRRDSQGQWATCQGQRTLEDAMAKADEVMRELK